MIGHACTITASQCPVSRRSTTAKPLGGRRRIERRTVQPIQTHTKQTPSRKAGGGGCPSAGAHARQSAPPRDSSKTSERQRTTASQEATTSEAQESVSERQRSTSERQRASASSESERQRTTAKVSDSERTHPTQHNHTPSQQETGSVPTNTPRKVRCGWCVWGLVSVSVGGGCTGGGVVM